MKKKFKLLNILILIGGVGISSIFSTSVLAGDEKSIPGTNCRDASNQDDISYIGVGMRNDVNRTNYVVCPIVRDNMTAQSQHFTNSVKVRLRKLNDANTNCVLISRTLSGNSGALTSGNVSGLGYRTLYIPTIRSYTSGSIFINCSLNSDEQIQGVNYDERWQPTYLGLDFTVTGLWF